MKLAICICERVTGKCSTMGCFKTYNNKEKYFSQYKDTNTELIALFSCNICSTNSTGDIITIAERLKNSEVHSIHLGACAVNCKADKLDEVKEIFTSIGISVVEGTH